jgi:hypothetical protein
MNNDLIPLNEQEKPKAKKKPGPKPKASKESTTEAGRSAAAHSPQGRARIPMGTGFTISYPEHLKDPDFFYYFVADDGGKVNRRIDAGFDHVLNDDGTKYIRRGNDGIDMVLMRQPMIYRNEDIELKRSESSAIVKAEQALRPGEYIPEDRTSKVQKDDQLDPMMP